MNSLRKSKSHLVGCLFQPGDARKLIKALIKPDVGDLENYRTKFLMADDPKNKGRFTATLDDLIDLSYRK